MIEVADPRESPANRKELASGEREYMDEWLRITWRNR